VGLCWVSGHAGARGNKITHRLAKDSFVQKFVGPEPFLGVSRQNIKNKIKRWVIISVWQSGVVLAALRDRLEN
jgi:hypothetical protein